MHLSDPISVGRAVNAEEEVAVDHLVVKDIRSPYLIHGVAALLDRKVMAFYLCSWSCRVILILIWIEVEMGIGRHA